MSKRGENIHKRKDGRWEGRYKKGRKFDGTLIYGSVYAKTYREVKEKLALAAANPEGVAAQKKGEVCFGEVLFLWLENNKVRHKGATINKYQYLINKHIIPELGDMKLSAVSSTVINSFLMEKMQNGRLNKKGGLSSSYVRSIMLIINSALKFAVDEQMCKPIKSQIYKPSIQKKEVTILSIEEQKQLENYLFAELDSTCIGILVSLYTGMRIGEICALRWEDIDLTNNIIYVRHTISRVLNNNITDKGNSKLTIDTPKTKASNRVIPIPSVLMSVLEKKSETLCSEFLVSDAKDFISPRTYEYRYHRLLEKCGLPSVNYHVLRHTFATRCIEAGVDVKSLSEILGHSNVSITLNTYVHSSMELKRSQLEKLSILTSY